MSGYEILDQEIVRAIKLVSPVDPHPEGIRKNHITVCGKFRYVREPAPSRENYFLDTKQSARYDPIKKLHSERFRKKVEFIHRFISGQVIYP